MCFCRCIWFHPRIPASSRLPFCHSISDSLHQSLTPSLVQLHTQTLSPHHFTTLLLPVVSKEKAASRRSMVSGRRTVAHSQARPHQRSASFHSRPRTSLTGTVRRKKAPETSEQSALTQTSPPLVFKDAALLVHTDHTLETAESLGAALENDEDKTRAPLLFSSVQFSVNFLLFQP